MEVNVANTVAAGSGTTGGSPRKVTKKHIDYCATGTNRIKLIVEKVPKEGVTDETGIYESSENVDTTTSLTHL